MKQIQLGHHQNRKYKNPIMWALVDDEDFEELSKYKWYSFKNGNTFYAARSEKGTDKHIQMHRHLLNNPSGMLIDHKNGYGLDNRRENLRACTRSQNAINQKLSTRNTSGIKGVWYVTKKNLWRVAIQKEKQRVYFGYFKTKEEAQYVHLCNSIKIHGEFRRM